MQQTATIRNAALISWPATLGIVSSDGQGWMDLGSIASEQELEAAIEQTRSACGSLDGHVEGRDADGRRIALADLTDE
jgi:hypothetical protein